MAKEFKLPEVGEGVESGTVVGLLVSAGDTIEVDQPVLELETDKAVVEVPSSVAGVVDSIDVGEGDEISVGQTILTVSEEGEGAGAEEAGAEERGEPGAEAAEPEEAAAGGAETGRAGTTREGVERAEAGAGRAAGERAEAREAAASPEEAAQAGPREHEREGERRLIPAAPSVRRLAREKGVDITRVEGSGILGRISADDILAHAEGRAPGRPAAAPERAGPARQAVELPDFSRWGEVERKSMSGIRKATVRAMSTAWSSIPMVTQFDKADITEFEKLRKRYQPKAEERGAKLTPTAMLIKVAAAALRRFPDFNASIDVENNEIVYKRYVNIGVAVDTEHGLLVPVIKGADRKNIIELAVELGELAEKARERKVSPEEMQGGNFSVSNLGGIGGTGFTPIVNPPDVAILGVSRGTYEPVYDRDTGEFEARLIMPLAVTYDHRLIDGAQAARFLRWVCTAIEEPFLMSLEG